MEGHQASQTAEKREKQGHRGRRAGGQAADTAGTDKLVVPTAFLGTLLLSCFWMPPMESPMFLLYSPLFSYKASLNLFLFLVQKSYKVSHLF